jgi:hypothetical protein
MVRRRCRRSGGLRRDARHRQLGTDAPEGAQPQDPRVPSASGRRNPYAYIEIRGKAVEITPKGGFEGIDKLSAKYTGQEKYPGNAPGDVRVVIKIAPEHVTGMG